MSARRASMDVVGHDGLVRDIRAGRMPSFDRLIALFEYLSVPFDFGEVTEPKVAGMAEGETSSHHSDFSRPEGLRAGFLPFPWHPALMRRGVGPVALSAEWLASRNLAPDSLAVVEARHDGAQILALVDGAASRQGQSDLWATLENGVCALCRVNWQAPQVVVLAGDRDHPARALTGADHGVRFLGRVVWMGGAPSQI
ncbi:hypothetical protein [Actibacterium sp. XHP0104]|uniref:hypothetical protein n=1 Tax=Actibacterium sp. XHP0104 TaxID=2984335 RepID=UPI0021E86889|nr:hypothetical protein [Actibacterium sp. XHP0104]MCV2880548.1 hypothetical protein [Actibacterium sp. XHP0104]